jgi:hypothetical protein
MRLSYKDFFIINIILYKYTILLKKKGVQSKPNVNLFFLKRFTFVFNRLKGWGSVPLLESSKSLTAAFFKSPVEDANAEYEINEVQP